MGGVPINIASKYLDKKIIAHNPDIVILQFATTDISINLPKKFNNIQNTNIKTPIIQEDYYNNEVLYKIKNFFRYLIKNLIAFVYRVKPITPYNIYIKSLEEIVNKLNNNNVKVIVLSPFVSPDIFTNIRARKLIKYVKELNERLEFTFIDCYSLLKSYKISEYLLSDRVHLSKNGHTIIANKIAEVLKTK